MGAVQDLVADVLSEGNFDATPAQALRWLTRRQRKMVARSRCFRGTKEIGPTVAGQREYVLPPYVVEIFEVIVDGRTYGTGIHTDLSANDHGWLWLSDDGGLVVPEEDPTGDSSIALIPTPTTAGLSVEVRGASLPPDLSTSDDTTLVIPADFYDELVAGAMATALVRVENRPDLAAVHEQVFDAGCEELRSRVQRKYRGPGPAQIRVRGYNA